ncbi:DNA-methyltransferase [Leminorella grimontii]|uniref:DNA-methyltransferase n=1 Tax=Leminorella grimontii TaxID=82981 RepID=UPI00321F85F2
MTQKQVIGAATLYCGDSLEILQTLPPASFAGLITDPPYSSGGLHIGSRQQRPHDKYTGRTETGYNVDFYGDNRDARSWGYWTMCWLGQAFHLLEPGAYSMIFTDWRQLPTLTDVFQGGGFTWRGIVPWDKTSSSRAPHTGYFRHQCEYVVWGSKGALSKADHGGPWPGLISQRVIPAEKLHMTGKPVPVMTDLIAPIRPGGTILDPFMGSASTGVAALMSGHPFVGIEMSTHYFDVACKRLEAAQATAES